MSNNALLKICCSFVKWDFFDTHFKFNRGTNNLSSSGSIYIQSMGNNILFYLLYNL